MAAGSTGAGEPLDEESLDQAADAKAPTAMVLTQDGLGLSAHRPDSEFPGVLAESCHSGWEQEPHLLKADEAAG